VNGAASNGAAFRKMAIVISFIQNQHFKTALVDYQQMAHGEK
jgi:hypothetical protein